MSSTLHEALDTPALPHNRQVTPDEVGYTVHRWSSIAPLLCLATIAAVKVEQLDCQANMIRRWKGDIKTTTSAMGSHVLLSMPAALLYGVEVIKAPCLISEEVRSQYHGLLQQHSC